MDITKKISLAWLLGALLVGCARQAPGPPNDARWQASLSAAQKALATSNAAALQRATLHLFDQARRMADTDSRVPESSSVLEQAVQELERLRPKRNVIKFLYRLNDMTKVPQGLGPPLSRLPAQMLYDLLMKSGRLQQARQLMANFEARAEADFGDTNPAARLGMRREADAAATMHDYDAALKLLARLAKTTGKVYGDKSPEYAEVLIAKAQVDLDREDDVDSTAAADQALSMIKHNPRASVSSFIEIAKIYEGTRQLAKARDAYQRVDLSVDSRHTPGYATTYGPVLCRLAYLNARLGDGASARKYLRRAAAFGETVAAESPETLLGVLMTEATVYNMAGEHDRAAQVIERYQRVAAASGLSRDPGARRGIVSVYLAAGRYAQAMREAEVMLMDAKPDTPAYAQAATLVALVAAEEDPPEPRTDLAKAAVALWRKHEPQDEPYDALYALALSYAAEGKWAESAKLEGRIIREQNAARGDYATDWDQWRHYAQALAHTGQQQKANEIRARLTAEVQPLHRMFSDPRDAAISLYEHNAFGFSVSLTDDKWQRWAGEATGWPIAAFTAEYAEANGRSDGTLVVVALLLPPGLTSDTAVMALSDLIGANYTSLKPWKEGALTGYKFTYEGSGAPGRSFRYNGHFIVKDYAVYAVLAAMDSDNPDALAAGNLALRQVNLGRAVSTTDLRGSDRKLEGLVLNGVGNALSARRRLDQALRIYKVAREFDASGVVARNIIFANLQLRHYEDVRNEVDHYPDNLAASPELYIWRALSEEALGDKKAAVSDYASGFDHGFRDDGSATEYVRLLLSLKRGQDAKTFLDKYAAAKLTPNVIGLEALLSFKLGDKIHLEQAMKRLRNPATSSPGAALIGAMIELQQHGVAGLTKLVGKLEQVGLTSGALYTMLANAQIQADLTDAARTSVERGLKVAPNNPQLKTLKKELSLPAPTQL